MAPSTSRDPSLLQQLAEWHRACGLPGALRWLWSDRFVPDYALFGETYPPGSDEDRMAARICGYFEAVGMLYKHGLIRDEVLFDWLEVAPTWDRIKGYALGRRRRGEPDLWANFEDLAVAHKRLTREYST
ncbi:MAG: hypothetical protein JOZ41_21070 [Chloroflexi bacterium]|nr:hypothetical protein [Chloroflexota bacterium]